MSQKNKLNYKAHPEDSREADKRVKGKTLTGLDRKRLAVVFTALLLGAVFVSAFALMNYPPNNTVFIGEKTHADSVTVYQNGVTFVSYKENISLEPGINTLEFYLPSSVILESLKIEGVNVLEIKTTGEQPFLEKGDKIIVRTQNGEYKGIFRGWDNGNLVLINGNKTVVLYDVQEIEVLNMAEPHIGEISVNATVDGEGNTEIRVSYLMRGTQWKASYFLDLDTGDIECWATLKGVENWKDVKLILVSGGPHIVYRGITPLSYGIVRYGSMSLSTLNNSGTSWSSSDVEEYHEYTLNRKITFHKGETTKLPLFSGKVRLRQEYCWKGGRWGGSDTVVNRYYINNTLSEPLPSGIVECYRSGKWVGEDDIKYTPIGDENPVTVGYAYDIKVTIKTISSGWDGAYYDRTYSYSGEITIKNFKTESIKMKLPTAASCGVSSLEG